MKKRVIADFEQKVMKYGDFPNDARDVIEARQSVLVFMVFTASRSSWMVNREVLISSSSAI